MLCSSIKSKPRITKRSTGDRATPGASAKRSQGQHCCLHRPKCLSCNIFDPVIRPPIEDEGCSVLNIHPRRVLAALGHFAQLIAVSTMDREGHPPAGRNKAYDHASDYPCEPGWNFHSSVSSMNSIVVARRQMNRKRSRVVQKKAFEPVQRFLLVRQKLPPSMPLP